MAKMLAASKYLIKKARIRSTGYPIGIIAHYGPTDQLATKVVVSIMGRNKKHLDMKRWFTTDEDARLNDQINEEIAEFLQEHDVTASA